MGIKTGVAEGRRKALSVETHRSEMARCGPSRKYPTQFGELCRLSCGMIHLEERRVLNIWNPISAAIKTCAENHDLADPGLECTAQELVDQGSARHTRSSSSGDAAIRVPGYQITPHGELGKSDCSPESRAQKVNCQRILKEPLSGRPGGLESSEERHVFGGPASLLRVHRFSNKTNIRSILEVSMPPPD